MDYDFSGLCADQLEKLNKRLNSLNKSFVKEYKIGLDVINNPDINNHRTEIWVEIEDLMNDIVSKTEILYTECLNKVQRTLLKYMVKSHG